MYWWPFLSSLLQVPTVLIDTYFLDYFVVFFLFLFCFSLFTFFISRLFFPHFDYFVFFCFCFFPSSWLTYLSALLFPNQPTNQPTHWRSALHVYSCRSAYPKFATHLGVTFELFVVRIPTHPTIPTTMHWIPYQLPSCTTCIKIHIGTIVGTNE